MPDNIGYNIVDVERTDGLADLYATVLLAARELGDCIRSYYEQSKLRVKHWLAIAFAQPRQRTDG